MNTIIHELTRGWFLLTPGGPIEIHKDDWDLCHYWAWSAYRIKHPSSKTLLHEFTAINHHPYSVDAKFVVDDRQIARSVKQSAGGGGGSGGFTAVVHAGFTEVVPSGVTAAVPPTWNPNPTGPAPTYAYGNGGSGMENYRKAEELEKKVKLLTSEVARLKELVKKCKPLAFHATLDPKQNWNNQATELLKEIDLLSQSTDKTKTTPE